MVDNTDRPAFEYITGAYNPRMYGPLATWVRYRAGPNEVKVLARGPKWVHLACPDRELLIVRNALTGAAPRPLDSSWDEFVPFGLCSTGSARLTLPRLMMNYMEHSTLDAEGIPRAQAKKSANLRMPGSTVREGRHLTSDCFVAGNLVFSDRGLITIAELAGAQKGKTAYEGDDSILTPQGVLRYPRKRFRSHKPVEVYTITTKSGHRSTCSKGQMFMTNGGWATLAELQRPGVKLHRTFGANKWAQQNADISYSVDTHIDQTYQHYPTKVYCPVCDQGFDKLDSHLTFRHGLNASECDLEFTMSRKVVSAFAKKKMKNNTLNFPTQMTPELAELIGYIVADGRLHEVVEITCGVKHVQAERIVELYAKVFGGKTRVKYIDPSLGTRYSPTAHIRPTPGIVYADVHLSDGGRYLIEFLKHLGVANGSKNKGVPWSVLQSTEPCVRAFIAALFSADGTVPDGPPSIYTSSRVMVHHLTALLTNYGVNTRTHHLDKGVKMPDGRIDKNAYGAVVCIRDAISARHFFNLFNMLAPHKRANQTAFMDRQASTSTEELALKSKTKGVTYTSSGYRQGRIEEEVVSIRKHRIKRPVYDVTMDDDRHAFTIGSGFVAHNSGGFQFLSGRIDWIDPIDLAGWYTNNVDEGITLDVPMPPGQENEYLLRAAGVQRKNYALLRANLPAKFNLINVVHGSNLDRSRKFRAQLEKDPTGESICLGGVYFGDNVYSLARLCGHLLDPNAKQYRHYHVLGIYNVAMTAPIIRLAALLKATGREITISTDASTAVYSANNRTMHLQRAHWKNVERVMLGRSTPVGAVPNPHRVLPCSCPVCSTFKYTDVLSHVDDATVAHTFILHNALEIERWMEQTLHYATVLDAAQFLELMTAQFKNDRRLFTLKISLQFVESVVANGLDSAMKEFSQYLGGMFGNTVIERPVDAGIFDRVIPEEPTANWFQRRVGEILGRYEDYHKKRPIVHEKRKASERVRQVSKVMSNSGVARAGKQKIKRTIKVSEGSSHSRTRVPEKTP